MRAGPFAFALVLALSGCTGEPASDCAAQLAEDQAKVRTNREWTEQDLPGLGGYTSVYWQARAAGNPCSRVPGPTDWRYQGVLLLTREDAEELAGRFDWLPLATSPSPDPDVLDAPAEMWPALVPFVPDGVRWLHSEEYAQTQSFGSRWGDVFLDPKLAVAFFVLYDH